MALGGEFGAVGVKGEGNVAVKIDEKKRGARFSQSTKKPSVVRLDYRMEDTRVIVTPQDNDAFGLTVEQAVRACRLFGDEGIPFEGQFNLLLRRCALWLLDHKKYVSDAYMTARDAGLLFLVVRKQKEYDGKFEDDLTALDISIARDAELDLIRLSVLAMPAIPDDVLESLLAPEICVLFHAKR